MAEFFTVVFHGDVTQFDDNPMDFESDFGKVAAIAVGNALDEIENIHEIEAAAEKLVEAINRRRKAE